MITTRLPEVTTVNQRAWFKRTDVETRIKEEVMGFGRGLLLWLLGIPLPIILLLALFWR